MNPKSYAVVIEPGPHSVGAYVPDLPGCVAAAKTVPQVEKLIRGAIEMHVQALREDGRPIPKPRAQVGLLEVAVEGTGVKAGAFASVDDLVRAEVAERSRYRAASTRKKSTSARRQKAS